jgi:ABC-type Fe2+-enterobactin transport system substrate-binding protein
VAQRQRLTHAATRRDSTPSLRGQIEQLRCASAAVHAGPGLAHQQGFFCQWRRMNWRRRQAAEQRQERCG